MVNYVVSCHTKLWFTNIPQNDLRSNALWLIWTWNWFCFLYTTPLNLLITVQQSVSETLSNLTGLEFATDNKKCVWGALARKCSWKEFYATERWKWEFQHLTKRGFGVSIQALSSVLSPSLHETTINERADFKGPLGWKDCMSGHLWKGEKKIPYCSCALFLSLSPRSLWELTEVLTVAVNSLRRPAGRQGSAAMGSPSALQGPQASAG